MLSSRIVPLSLASHSSDFYFIFFHFPPLYFSPLFRMACSACLWQIYGCLYFVWLINSAVIYVSGGFSDSTSFSSAPCLSELCVFALLEVIRCLAVTLWEFISLNSSLSHISLLHDLLLLKTKLMLVMCSVHACARRWLSAGFVWVYQELHFLPRAWSAAEFFFCWKQIHLRAQVLWQATRSCHPCLSHMQTRALQGDHCWGATTLQPVLV